MIEPFATTAEPYAGPSAILGTSGSPSALRRRPTTSYYSVTPWQSLLSLTSLIGIDAPAETEEQAPTHGALFIVHSIHGELEQAPPPRLMTYALYMRRLPPDLFVPKTVAPAAIYWHLGTSIDLRPVGLQESIYPPGAMYQYHLAKAVQVQLKPPAVEECPGLADDIVAAASEGRPLDRSESLRSLAERIASAPLMKQSIEEWAAALAEDLSCFDD
jgi:hypothetical protein